MTFSILWIFWGLSHEGMMAPRNSVEFVKTGVCSRTIRVTMAHQYCHDFFSMRSIGLSLHLVLSPSTTVFTMPTPSDPNELSYYKYHADLIEPIGFKVNWKNSHVDSDLDSHLGPMGRPSAFSSCKIICEYRGLHFPKGPFCKKQNIQEKLSLWIFKLKG